MWKLEHISARNICSFCELEYTMLQGVTTLIFGHNKDNKSQQSNGSGKSTLIEAIALGITGWPLRKVRSEEIINDGAEECFVRLNFYNDFSNERMILQRKIYRRGSSNVIITLENEEKKEEVALSSVDAANKYILERMGITRDELYGSYILSRHRYQDFLSASDKDKKDTINRFSNGILVDQAIEKIGQDIEPLQEQLHDIDLELAGIDGRTEMLVEQIDHEESVKAEKQRTQEEKIIGMKTTISEKRNLIRECKESVAYIKSSVKCISGLDEQIQALEDSKEPFEKCIGGIRQLLESIPDARISDWVQIIRTKKNEIDSLKAEADKWYSIINNTYQKSVDAEKELETIREQFREFGDQEEEQYKKFMAEMDELQERFDQANERMEKQRKRKLTLSRSIEILEAKISGTVTCPSCSHEFLLSDKSFDIDSAREELDESRKFLETTSDNLLDSELEAEKVEQMQTHLKSEIRNLSTEKEAWVDRLQKAERQLQSVQYEMEGNKFNLKRIENALAERNQEVGDIRRNMFDEAYEIIATAIRTNKRRVEQEREKIAAAESSIDTLEQTIGELENSSIAEVIEKLRADLKEYRKKSSSILLKRGTIEGRLNALNEQQQVFIQFKGYLANTKINALSSMMNQVLVELGSDLRVNLSGYTTLKSGAIREKISVSIIRDGVDAGSFSKFSEGEKTRVNIASIVAMQKLVNANCEMGKGLDFLAIDELADSMDFDGLASVFSTLNNMGVSALVVSHGLTSEAYPYRLTICKENGESRIGDY